MMRVYNSVTEKGRLSPVTFQRWIEKKARERAPKTKTPHKRQINIQRLRQSTRWSEAEICMVSKMNSISMLRSAYREQPYRPFRRSPTVPGFEATQ